VRIIKLQCVATTVAATVAATQAATVASTYSPPGFFAIIVVPTRGRAIRKG